MRTALYPSVIALAVLAGCGQPQASSPTPAPAEPPAAVKVEPATTGPKIPANLTPEQKIAIDHFIRFANDPTSVEVIEVKSGGDKGKDYISQFGKSNGDVVYAVIRAKNKYGHPEVNKWLFLISDNAVYEVISEEREEFGFAMGLVFPNY
jgi:hypothetical protein